MSDQTMLALSTVDGDGNAHYANCQLVVGDGTVKIEFKNGRALVPVAHADLINRNPHIEIPALTVLGGDTVPIVAPVVEPGGVLEGLRARVAELEAMLMHANQKAAHGGNTEVGSTQNVDLPPDRAELIELAKQHLADEGEGVPDPGPSSPGVYAIEYKEPFEALTADGQPRCRAKKGDGSQCANQVRSADACHLPQHQAQLAQLAVSALPTVSA